MFNIKLVLALCAIFVAAAATIDSDLDEENFRRLKDKGNEENEDHFSKTSDGTRIFWSAGWLKLNFWGKKILSFFKKVESGKPKFSALNSEISFELNFINRKS